MEMLQPFLDHHSTLTLATVSPAGGAAAADLYFASDGSLKLFFLSESESRHAENIKVNPQVAATIHAQAWDWREIRGLQLEGACRKVTSPAERAAALARYARKFSFVGSLAQAGVNAFLAKSIARHAVYQIIPSWIRWLDNSETFGHKEEWSWRDGGWVAGRG